MKRGLSLILLALLAVTSVHSIPTIDSGDLTTELASKADLKATLEKYLTILKELELGDLDEAQNTEIGPNFDTKQFLGMVKRVNHQSWEKRCKKISGNDNAYTKAVEATKQAKTCFENWSSQTAFGEDYKLILKNVCTGRNAYFQCLDKYISDTSDCYFPSERESTRKIERVLRNMMDLVCSNDENDFAIFEPEGEGVRCVHMSMNEVMTCANKAAFSVTERVLQKWIENEHFNFEMETEDCKVYDEVKSCFVSSVENCTNPKVKNIISSAFQIIRDETKC